MVRREGGTSDMCQSEEVNITELVVGQMFDMQQLVSFISNS